MLPYCHQLDCQQLRVTLWGSHFGTTPYPPVEGTLEGLGGSYELGGFEGTGNGWGQRRGTVRLQDTIPGNCEGRLFETKGSRGLGLGTVCISGE